MEDKGDLIFGRNPVREALRGGRPLNRLLLARGITPRVYQELVTLAREQGVPVQSVERAFLDRLTGGQAHQGVAAYPAEQAYVDVEDLLLGREKPFILVANEIQDPHNLGAILRTAEAANVDGVVIPVRRAAALTGTVAKAAAGAAAYVPVARVTNIARTLRWFKDQGLWIVGADAAASTLFWDADLAGPLALVIGGEAAGLGRVVREECDLLVRLPMLGRINSLNASVAAALLMYEVLRQRRRPEA
ncbi:MAG: 23S rRNA (guanosine(2251)-2'-O)-methyltransferase RlmB [Thermoanaerobacterales bacterium]|nr:23S rRNA (guanosine(2251)-2'-O)-methyltransferase RlmB [Bacillota bacterium]MDI6907563.1 23S rRNA (guanosine(2251)-2'-O)-methyltransferase RlmB [Thermoanaerobacterales bacterium]